ncbi:MAG: hypothetical protein CVV64_10095 [Candidatus Wallbacteria bacterium HGW-Wallbacteria-1]|jgi:radical SAM protein with 4Fe4S-binding SPASM domain|uniref:Radical SAM core domain-containing protein n=1 Tax=Candidatus Wallbacteria bacterium HGW-Wallbacteria-1 TaxID=2013854 RepID=A0A2N1PPP1_9BACT|nr:MAG: hypothetical protein CVV64_10095 [Candidatus Wallbacteria bacterium HGW-Wallbacteria-1]
MMNDSFPDIEIIFRCDDYFILRRDLRVYLFIPELSLLSELNVSKCISGSDDSVVVKSEFRAILTRIMEEIELDGGHSSVLAAKGNESGRFSAINLNLTDKCNLACVYCYAKGGDYRRIANSMSASTVISALSAARDSIDRTQPFRFEFFGGEPLLNEEAIRDILLWQQGEGRKILPERVINRVSTNLTHLTDSMLELLKRGSFILSVSIDGDRETQNLQRPFRNGEGSFETIMGNIVRIREAWPEAVIVARMTAHNRGNRLLEDLDSLIATGLFDYSSIYPAAVDDNGRGNIVVSSEFQCQYLEMAEQYGELISSRSLSKDHCQRRFEGRYKGCLELNRYICHILEGSCAINHCRAGIGYCTLSPDGTVHPCHRLIGSEEFRVAKGLSGLDEVDSSWRANVLDRDECSVCSARYLCGGGCRQENLIATGDLLGVSARNCSFANLLMISAIAALDSIKLVSNGDICNVTEMLCSSLDDLFVLCGQPKAGNHCDTLRKKVCGMAAEFMI